MSKRLHPLVGAILLASAACSPNPIPSQPTLLVSITAINCWANGACGSLSDGGFYSANYVGTAPSQAVQLMNKSSADVTIQSITQSGDSAFTWALAYNGDAGTVPLTIPGLKQGFLNVVFTPPSAKSFSGKLILNSNAVTTTIDSAQSCGPACEIDMSGMGVKPPPPFLASIMPNSGTAAGGTQVVLAGTGFLPGATVTFNGMAASNVMVDNNELSITCNTPMGSQGFVQVGMSNMNGDVATTVNDAGVTFYYCMPLSDGGCI